MMTMIGQTNLEINDRNSPIKLQILWMGFITEEVYYEMKKRKMGKSSWTFSKFVCGFFCWYQFV